MISLLELQDPKQMERLELARRSGQKSAILRFRFM